MKKFSLVSKADLDKINGNNIKNLGPERQVKAIRMWIDQNIKKHGPSGGTDSDEEMQEPILSGRDDLHNPCDRVGPLRQRSDAGDSA